MSDLNADKVEQILRNALRLLYRADPAGAEARLRRVAVEAQQG